VVQASLKLVLEPMFEADFKPCSYGFRPRRRAHDAIAEIYHFAFHGYPWMLEGDIKACFDEIDHTALLGRVRDRIGDRHVVDLVKAFLKAGILTEDGDRRDPSAGTPQGGILSPLLANIALSVLDVHYAEAWQQMGTSNDMNDADATVWPTIALCDTRTTSSSWWPGTEPTLKVSARRPPRCLSRRGFVAHRK